MSAIDGRVFTSAGDVEAAVEEFGFLPFFRGELAGFSIEEHTPADLWFSPVVDGPWEWKGPIVRGGRAAYAKYFRGKAVYVSRRWLPHLVNFRRASRTLSYDEERVLSAIVANESLLSTEIREECGFGAHGLRAAERALLAAEGGVEAPHASLDAVLNRLQMSGHIVVSDFEYNIDKKGRPYGWGVARYSTPETLYADWFEMPQEKPEESRLMVKCHLMKLCPEANAKTVEKVVGR